jgi:hypothetical protein
MTPASCYSVPANSLYNLPALGLPYASGTKFLFLNWVSNTSSLFFRINHLYQASVRRRLVARHIMLPDWPWNYYPLGPAAGAALLQRIGHDIGTMPDLRGTAFFGHLLLPHAPYYLREDCGVSDDLFKPSAPWEPFAMPRAERRRVYYERYFPQVRCLTQQVAAILDTLEKRGGGDAVVIIQGDHGARIGKPLPPMEQPLAREDFEDFYSTLFAVRGPGIMPGIDTSVVAIRDLLDRFSQTGFTRLELSQDPAPFVYRVPDVASALRVRVPIPSATDTSSPQAAAPVQALRLRPPVRSPLPAP